MKLKLTRDEAVVLFDFLADLDARQIRYADAAEEIVLWSLHAQLEQTLVEPFDPDYLRVLQRARDRLRSERGF